MNTSPLLPIIFRQAEPDDLGFIIRSWIESYRNAPANRNTAKADYFRDQHLEVMATIQHAAVTIAALQEDPDTICGFICHEKNQEGLTLLHYVYTKLLFRRDGIARSLFAAIEATEPTVCTHTNVIFNKLRHSHNLITERDYDTLLRVNSDPVEAYKQQQANKRTK